MLHVNSSLHYMNDYVQQHCMVLHGLVYAVTELLHHQLVHAQFVPHCVVHKLHIRYMMVTCTLQFVLVYKCDNITGYKFFT